MPTIDVQVHAYERNHPGRPWVGTLHGPAEVTGDQMAAALEIAKARGFSYWDSAIVAAAQALGCDELYTEDLSHGQQLGGVTVVNPFR